MALNTWKITVEGHGEITANDGERLVHALERGGIQILHRCGGKAKCTTCGVKFEEGEPDAMTVAEYDKLTEKELLDVARLSCQIVCRSDMTLKVLQTVESSGLEAGTAPGDTIEPEPQWTVRPGASTQG